MGPVQLSAPLRSFADLTFSRRRVLQSLGSDLQDPALAYWRWVLADDPGLQPERGRDHGQGQAHDQQGPGRQLLLLLA